MKKLIIFLMTVGLSFSVWAQSEKYSISTQMFLDEQAGRISFEKPADFGKNVKGAKAEQLQQLSKYDKFIADPVEKSGVKFISAFVRVKDRSVVSELEALGVEVECEFLDGTLFTTLIPVDKIEEVAKLAKVTHLNVATKKRPLTDKARQYSNVDDVLSFTDDARSAGLPNAYDGSGVLLGVIDTGIDFQHKAFKDASGNFRIKRAYVYNGSNAREYGDGASYSLTTSTPTTDDNEEDHGTHTSSTAGGSSVIINGSTTTVTTDHASATYGGMAPAADLYLAGINGLSDTYIANSFQKICNYADSKGLPVVVSNSWGASLGPRDGTGDIADICSQYFSEDNPNHICLFAASNDAGTNGFHVSGTGTSSSPLGTVINYNADYINYYYGFIADAWTRSTGVTLNCKVYVLNSSGTVVASATATPSANGSRVSLSSGVSSGSLVAYRNFVSSSKSEVVLYANSLRLSSGYKLAVEFYPSSGSSLIDVWAGSYSYFTSTPSTSGYTWTAGSDDMCVSDEATIPTVISVGAYSTKNSVKDYNNRTHALNEFTVGDIAYFSSWASASASPTGEQYPWICAPGATVVAGVNAYDTSGEYSYINGNSAYYGLYRVNTDTTNPYGSMEGTSMATPAAAGIVALWLQVAKDNNIELTTTDIKTIMKETAITDSYTNGTNAAHFGNGKIDALAGIEYILNNYANNPRIIANPGSVEFGSVEAGTTNTKTFTVTGTNLTGNVTLTLDDPSNVFTVSPTTVAKATAEGNGATITVTFKPTAKLAGVYNGTITLTSANATEVVVPISGTATYTGPSITVNPANIAFGEVENGTSTSQNLKVAGTSLTDNITLTLLDENNVFRLSTTTVTRAQALSGGVNVSVTFTPKDITSTQNYTASVKLSSADVADVIVPLTGTGHYTAPAITVTPTELALRAGLDENVSKTFTVTGVKISDDLNVTLTDTKNVFTVSPATISASALADGGSATVTVTFRSAAEGNFTGSVRVGNDQVEPVTVSLTASANDGGTASDAYLNIAKYATIDDAGATVSGMETIYKYTEYSDQECAWLTVSNYGVVKTTSTQKWFTSEITNTASGSWTASDIFLGDDSYFGSANSYYANWATNALSQYFYVTNCTQVKQLAFNRNSSRYPLIMRIYECTQNSDGTLTAGTTPIDTKQSTTNNNNEVLTSETLDANKIYKVQIYNDYSYLYEIGFQTPVVKTPQLLGDVNLDGKVDIADINIVSDIILGLDDASNYDRRAYLNDDDVVNISDLNILVSIVLGTE